jgi:hypothetical protein
MAVGDGNDHEDAVVNTFELEEKAMAFEQLVLYSKQVISLFQPFLERTLRVCCDALLFKLNNDIRRVSWSVEEAKLADAVTGRCIVSAPSSSEALGASTRSLVHSKPRLAR